MKTKKVISILVISILSAAPTFACSVCFTARDAKTTEHMAIAIWVLLGAVMSVLGGVSAFSFHLWRHAHTPLQPHEELVEENFDQYE